MRYEDEVKGIDAKPVPCTPRLLGALKAIRHLRGPRALVSDNGSEMTPKMIKRWIQRAEAKAGLGQIGRIHIFRHTFCSHLAMAGVPARTIQELARHKSLAVTMRYMHLSPSAKDEGIALRARSREAGGKIISGNPVATDRKKRCFGMFSAVRGWRRRESTTSERWRTGGNPWETTRTGGNGGGVEFSRFLAGGCRA